MPILKDLELYLGGEKIGKAYLGHNLIYGLSSLLLDNNPGAAIALSLRKLSSSYSGACIRVRRSSDNVEQDIGFVDGVVNIAALQSFVGGFDGYVTTWYDQSGNSNNAIQSVATEQAIIINSGNVIVSNNTPSILFDTYKGYTTTYNLGTTFSILGILKVTTSDYTRAISSIDTNSLISLRRQTYAIYNEAIIVDSTFQYTELALVNLSISSTESRFFVNSNDITNYTDQVNHRWGLVGLGNENLYPAEHYFGYMSEVIIYPTAQINNRVPLESNIINYYNII